MLHYKETLAYAGYKTLRALLLSSVLYICIFFLLPDKEKTYQEDVQFAGQSDAIAGRSLYFEEILGELTMDAEALCHHGDTTVTLFQLRSILSSVTIYTIRS